MNGSPVSKLLNLTRVSIRECHRALNEARRTAARAYPSIQHLPVFLCVAGVIIAWSTLPLPAIKLGPNDHSIGLNLFLSLLGGWGGGMIFGALGNLILLLIARRFRGRSTTPPPLPCI